MRQALTPAIEEELRGALTESEYARYRKEHQRPALLEAIRARVLAGQDLRSVTREITSSTAGAIASTLLMSSPGPRHIVDRLRRPIKIPFAGLVEQFQRVLDVVLGACTARRPSFATWVKYG